MLYIGLMDCAISNKQNQIKKGILWSTLAIVYNVPTITIETTNEWFIFLTLIIVPCALLTTWSNQINNVKLYVILILSLEIILLEFFTTNNIMWFYIWFELSLLPLYLIISIISNNRSYWLTRAIKLLFIYTLVGSIIMLAGIIQYISINDNILIINATTNKIVWWLFFIGLSFKIPLLPLHIWLFRAHTEASVSVSIILSSVILKIATYGYIKLLLNISLELTTYYSVYIETLIIISLIYSGLSAYRQHDIKALVAISSVNHQSITIIGLFSITGLIMNDNLNYIGPIILSIGHGIVSPALFLLTGAVLYDRYHTRTIYYYRGLSIPLFNSYLLLFCLINLSIPLSLNFYGEWLSIITAVNNNIVIGVLASTTIILSALYSILLWSNLALGNNKYLYFNYDLNRREFYLISLFALYLIILGLYPNLIISYIYYRHKAKWFMRHVWTMYLIDKKVRFFLCLILCLRNL